MRFVVATHGHCFDGLASAVLFTRLVGGPHPNAADFTYFACGYGPDQRKPTSALLQGEENAILDYRYLPAQELTWYFDHHPTAFASLSDRAHFGSRPAGRFFFDDKYTSCTRLIAEVAATRFGVDDAHLRGLTSWADKIDAARFSSAAEAISRNHPVLELATVAEHEGGDTFLAKAIPELLRRPLLEVAKSEWVQDAYSPLRRAQQQFIDLVRERGQAESGVVFVDVADNPHQSLGKFVPYALFPDSVYSVVVGLVGDGAKVSVGYNPWSGRPRRADIGQICARYGGGGHAFVGGISLGSSHVGEARAIAAEVALELAS